MLLSTYNNVVISDQTSHSEMDDILIKIGSHQELALNPDLFSFACVWFPDDMGWIGHVLGFRVGLDPFCVWIEGHGHSNFLFSKRD